MDSEQDPGKARFRVRSLQGPEKGCIQLKRSWKGLICSPDPKKEYFVLQRSLKQFMDFERTLGESLECKDFTRFLHEIYNSQSRADCRKRERAEMNRPEFHWSYALI